MNKKLLLTAWVLVLFGFSTVAAAQACTYSEAMLAFKDGNAIRGQALMNMAAKDGDQRAVRFLASFKGIDQAIPTIMANSSAPTTTIATKEKY
ncbi:hypothetical protein [Kaarinaea lacus]